MVTKLELLQTIGMIEGLCEVINEETACQNDLVCVSIAQIHFGVELVSPGDEVSVQVALLTSMKWN